MKAMYHIIFEVSTICPVSVMRLQKKSRKPVTMLQELLNQRFFTSLQKLVRFTPVSAIA